MINNNDSIDWLRAFDQVIAILQTSPFYSFLKDGAGFIVALAAIGLTIYEGRATRRHNRLSVKPMLFIQHEFHLEELENGGPVRFQIILSNRGLGPALIKSATYFINESEQLPPKNHLALYLRDYAIRLEEESETPFSASVRGTHCGEGFLIQAGTEVILADFTSDLYTPNTYNPIYLFFKNLKSHITYTNLYGEEFVCKRG